MRTGITVKLTLKQVVYIFNYEYNQHKQEGDTKQDFYCGITHDLHERNLGHKIDDSEIICHIRVASFAQAREVETALHEAGFNTGDQLNNGIESTKIVYMFRLREGVVI